MASASVQALRQLTETISFRNPTLREGAGSTPRYGARAVVGAMERQDDAAAAQPDEGGVQQLGQQLDAGIVPGQRKGGASKVFINFLTIASTENSSPCKNSLGRTLEP